MQWSAAELRTNVACRAPVGALVGTGWVLVAELAVAVFFGRAARPGTASWPQRCERPG